MVAGWHSTVGRLIIPKTAIGASEDRSCRDGRSMNGKSRSPFEAVIFFRWLIYAANQFYPKPANTRLCLKTP